MQVNKHFNQAIAKKMLPKRKSTDSKSRGGKCLIIAGSKNMLGAGVLAATAAARVGAGYTYLASENVSFDFKKNPDFIYLGKISDKKFLKTDFHQFSSIAIGPGLTNKSAIKKILSHLYKIGFANLVIDASALNALSESKQLLLRTWILTPHEGELTRLIKQSAKKIKASRLTAIKTAQKKFAGIVLLKGKQTLILDKNNLTKITSGNPALAKAGTGDVLTGMIAGFLAQGTANYQAACLACYAHGLCARHWVKSGNDHLSLLASDLLQVIPKVLAKIRSSRPA